MRVSSNATLFFKLFFPVGWAVFFGALTISLHMADEETLPFLTAPFFKYPFTLFYFGFLFLISRSVFKLLRVEMWEEHYIASNYFKSYRLIYDDIESITKLSLGRLSWVTFRLKGKGSLGSKIMFLQSNNLYRIFTEANPVTASKLEAITK
jgi:hypothetical protein